MKMMQILMFFIFLNAMIYAFSVVGCFGSTTDIGIEPGEIKKDGEGWAIKESGIGIQGVLEMVGFKGIGSLILAGFITTAAIVLRVSALTALAIGVMTGLFTNTFLTVWQITAGITDSMGIYAFIGDAIFMIIYSGIAFVIVYTVGVQAGIGGAKSYD